MKKCPQTNSAKHIFDRKIFIRWSGEKYNRMEDVSPWLGESKMESVEHEKAIYYLKCIACGFIDDSKEIIE